MVQIASIKGVCLYTLPKFDKSCYPPVFRAFRGVVLKNSPKMGAYQVFFGITEGKTEFTNIANQKYLIFLLPHNCPTFSPEAACTGTFLLGREALIREPAADIHEKIVEFIIPQGDESLIS